MVTIEMSSLSENHLLAAILANVRMITAVFLYATQYGYSVGSTLSLIERVLRF